MALVDQLTLVLICNFILKKLILSKHVLIKTLGKSVQSRCSTSFSSLERQRTSHSSGFPSSPTKRSDTTSLIFSIFLAFCAMNADNPPIINILLYSMPSSISNVSGISQSSNVPLISSSRISSSALNLARMMLSIRQPVCVIVWRPTDEDGSSLET